MFKLNGKKVLITGAGGGIGSVMARAFHKQGAIVGLADIKEDFVKPLADELKDRCFVIETGDISNADNVKNLATTAEDIMNGVDVLVNNAGITKDNLLLRMTVEDWDAVLDINLRTPFLLSKYLLPKMMKRNWGRVVNIASVVGVMGNAGQTNYSASKGGLIAMTKTLAREFALKGITVNAVAPGYIATKMTDVLAPEVKDKLLSAIPMKAMGTPDDVAASVVFLSSEEAKYITGQTININGGMVMN